MGLRRLQSLVMPMFVVLAACGEIGGGDVEIRLGDDVFEAGRVDRMAAEIDDRGPLLYSDLAGGTRDLIIQHLGESPETGWVAFEARPPGAPRECAVTWLPADEVFEDPCTETRYPPDGEGLNPFGVSVVDGELVVDLNAAARDPAESTTTSASVIVSGEPRDGGDGGG